ncbi:MAG: hypothetical protein D6712_05160, partial [Chloroflexi bacterium]
GVSDRQYNSRLRDELTEWLENKDPIGILERYLTEKYKNIQPELKKLIDQAQRVVAASVEYAENSPVPTYEDLISNVYV